MAIRMVALDIDGTLVAPGVHYGTLPDDSMARAVAALHEVGIVVVLASGRMFPGTQSVADHLGIDQPLICQQGASVHEVDGTLRHGHSIEEEIALELLDYGATNGWPVAWFDSVRYLVTEHCDQAQFFADVSVIEMEIHQEPHRSGVRATGIDIISDRRSASAVHAELERRYGKRLSLLDFPSVTAVHAPQASKGNALDALATELGVDPSEVLAIGDSVNDVSMLAWAGQSAAPGHCDRHARQAAKEILVGDGVDGVVARLTALADSVRLG